MGVRLSSNYKRGSLARRKNQQMSTQVGKGLIYGAAALAIVAIVVASISAGLVLSKPANTPVTRDIFLVAGEWKTTLSNTTLPAGSMLTNGTVLTQSWVISGSTKVDVERYRWDPVVLVATKGDTLRITVHVVNGNDHTFIISEYNVDVTNLDKVFRYTPSDKPGLQFVADKAGIFQYTCTTHIGMSGYLFVED